MVELVAAQLRAAAAKKQSLGAGRGLFRRRRFVIITARLEPVQSVIGVPRRSATTFADPPWRPFHAPVGKEAAPYSTATIQPSCVLLPQGVASFMMVLLSLSMIWSLVS